MEKQKQIIDSLRKYGIEFQIKCISCLLSDRPFMERIQDIVEADFFDNDAQKWILKESVKYFREYKDLPTLTVFKIRVDTIADNELLKKSVVDNLKLVYQKLEASDLNFVKEQFLEFCKNQKLKLAVLQSADLLEIGKYEQIKSIIDDAMKAGMERNIGHEYDVDIEKRMSVMARNTIKTNWNEIDTIMDGGLGPGELGIVVAPAGIGKCVGPNTEIEIQYVETGIPVKSNSGKEYILWFKPFDKFEFDDKQLFGWQIDNILFEIEKLKQSMHRQA